MRNQRYLFPELLTPSVTRDPALPEVRNFLRLTSLSSFKDTLAKENSAALKELNKVMYEAAMEVSSKLLERDSFSSVPEILCKILKATNARGRGKLRAEIRKYKYTPELLFERITAAVTDRVRSRVRVMGYRMSSVVVQPGSKYRLICIKTCLSPAVLRKINRLNKSNLKRSKKRCS